MIPLSAMLMAMCLTAPTGEPEVRGICALFSIFLLIGHFACTPKDPPDGRR